MSLIETSRVDDLAQALFDDAVVPLARTRLAAGRREYFPVAPDGAVTSYFTPVSSTGETKAIDFPGGGHAEGLIDALADVWSGQGETDLAAMAPALRRIAAALRTERGQDSGDVDIYCYTMF